MRGCSVTTVVFNVDTEEVFEFEILKLKIFKIIQTLFTISY